MLGLKMTGRTGLLLGVLAPAVLLAGCGKQEPQRSAFEQEAIKQFAESCRSSATGKGATAEQASQACDCAQSDLFDGRTIQEAMTMGPDKIQPIVEKCATEAGLR